jgi:hypothetical protein
MSSTYVIFSLLLYDIIFYARVTEDMSTSMDLSWALDHVMTQPACSFIREFVAIWDFSAMFKIIDPYVYAC